MSRRRGFTLIELMVALVVVATVATAVYLRGGETVGQIAVLERRTLARWVAENEIERARLARHTAGEEAIPLAAGATRRRVTLGGREWSVEANVSTTSHPWLRRVEYSVFVLEDGEQFGPVDQVTAFIGQY
ncbi:MAG: type II secretion system protein GspI [Gammaproteobacteria bacterium]|nr:type II secretion system protein GspI [Gammaproteobacteria bacterium]